MPFSSGEYEQFIYQVMNAILDDPSEKWPQMIQKLGVEKSKLFQAFDYIDREGLISGMSFSRGKGGTIVVPWTERAIVTAKGIDFMKRIEGEKAPDQIRAISEEQRPSVFISYNWDNEDVVADLEKALDGKAEVYRDKNKISAWGSLSNFMKSIREQDFAVLVISDAYLKSDACLFEVMQLMKDENWNDKAMYVVLQDSYIYHPLGRAAYVKYWAEKYNELEKAISSLPRSATVELAEDLRKAGKIRDNISTFLSQVADVNNPKVERAIREIVVRVDGANYSADGSAEEQIDAGYSLSSEATSILLKAIEDGEGIILCSQTLMSYGISINNKCFQEFSYDQGREIATWKGAVDELFASKLIEDMGDKHEVFRVTLLGYAVSDKIAVKE